MANALALPVMRCLVLAVKGLAEKCLSSRIWCSVCSIKRYRIKIFWFEHEIQEALPNVKSGVEVDESGDLWVSVIEESVESRFSSLRKQSLVRRATLDRCNECGLSKREWYYLKML